MPELPEVETTLRGLQPHVLRRRILDVTVRRRDMRQPVSSDLGEITGCEVRSLSRRSKYLLLGLSDASILLIHLGMSGSLRMVVPASEWRKHDHVAIDFDGGLQMRYHDPRRFGLMLRIQGNPNEHDLLRELGPEPLGDDFTGETLKRACRSRSTTIKQLIMDGHIVVGVGNIYASEALFRAGIRPRTAAGRISGTRLCGLAQAIRETLAEAISQGGTTLRDFLHSTGEPGYFRQRLMVYERAGQPCRACGTSIRHAVVGQRATYWCPRCQH